MRIGIDGACWLNRRGYGRFARELVTQLVGLKEDVEYTLMVDFNPNDAPAIPEGLRVVRVPTRRPAARAAAAAGRRSLRDIWATSRAISRERFDLVFFPSAYSYVPTTGGAHVVVVIHDVTAERFPRQIFPTRRAALSWRIKLLMARRQADLMLTISEASRQAISQEFGIAADRIDVISAAADPLFRQVIKNGRADHVLARWDLTETRFILYVGGISPHKNLGTLVDAFAGLHRSSSASAYRLVLVGDVSDDVFYSDYEHLQQKIARLGLGRSVVFTGYVEDSELVYLYNAADALVLPSLWEGFGLPVMEAMACATPVVASARGALPEVIGSAGVLFDPDCAADLQRALERVLTDDELQARLRREGPRRAAQFSWHRAAEETLAAFRRVAGRSDRAARYLTRLERRRNEPAG